MTRAFYISRAGRVRWTLNAGQTCETLLSDLSGVNQINYVWTPASARHLTGAERERLQGFPDDWTRGAYARRDFRAQGAAVGDAVTVPVFRWLARRV